MQNGVKTIEHKNWNTKKFYTISGHLAATYFKCPRNLRFKSKMVNDENQHLCGGWKYFEDENQTILERTINGLKPMGHIAYWNEKKDIAYETYKRLEKK